MAFLKRHVLMIPHSDQTAFPHAVQAGHRCGQGCWILCHTLFRHIARHAGQCGHAQPLRDALQILGPLSQIPVSTGLLRMSQASQSKRQILERLVQVTIRLHRPKAHIQRTQLIPIQLDVFEMG
jgi:hypothetical protein